MFRIECFCDDKKLANVLRALTGLVVGAPAVMPVVNAKKENKQIKQLTGGKLVEQFAEWLKDKRGKIITAENARAFMKEVGGSPSSYTYVLKQGIEAKLLKKTGKGTRSQYTVLAAKA